jgi:hypothetical protein
MAGMRLAADFEDLNEVRASLDAVADGLGRALAEGIAQDAQPLLETTKALTPYGPGPYPGADEDSDSALPHIRDMLAVTVQGGTISLIASHPGAVVHEFGGTIAPKGVGITFKPQAMARRAAVQHLPEIERAVEARIARML